MSQVRFFWAHAPRLIGIIRDLVETNRRRSRQEFEYELLDTGGFDGNRHFDVFVEYAKASPEAAQLLEVGKRAVFGRK